MNKQEFKKFIREYDINITEMYDYDVIKLNECGFNVDFDAMGLEGYTMVSYYDKSILKNIIITVDFMMKYETVDDLYNTIKEIEQEKELLENRMKLITE